MNQTEFVNLPPEVICIIMDKHNLPLKDLRSFKSVCLTNQYLYNNLYPIVIQDIRKRDILKIHLHDSNSRVDKFLDDYQFLIQSQMNVSVELPGKHQLSQVQLLQTRLMELLFQCHPRVKQLFVYKHFPGQLLRPILTKLWDALEMIGVFYLYPDGQSELLQSNARLEYLYLKNLTKSNLMEVDGLSNVRELILWNCEGDYQLSKASNLEALELKMMDLNVSTVTLPSTLQGLKLSLCTGNLSSVLSQAAPRITRLQLSGIDLETSVNQPFTNLKSVSIDEQRFNVRNSPLLTRAGVLKELITENQSSDDESDEESDYYDEETGDESEYSNEETDDESDYSDEETGDDSDDYDGTSDESDYEETEDENDDNEETSDDNDDNEETEDENDYNEETDDNDESSNATEKVMFMMKKVDMWMKKATILME